MSGCSERQLKKGRWVDTEEEEEYEMHSFLKESRDDGGLELFKVCANC